MIGLTIRIELTGTGKRANKSSMSIWMDNAIARLVQAEKKAEKEREWLLHKHDVIKAKLPVFWQQFLTYFKVDINKFNGTFQGERSLHISETVNLRELSVIRDSSYPEFELRVSLRERTLDYEYKLTLDKTSDTVSSSCSLELDLDSAENIVVLYHQKKLSYDELSEVLLEPVLFPDQPAL